MAIKRYTAIADNTITNQFNSGLSKRNTSANTGLADSLEIFKMYGQVTSSSVEQARILIKFPVNETGLNEGIKTIKQDRDSGILPASGTVKFFMKLHDVAHPETLPRNYKLVAHPLTVDWTEGLGLDLDEYSDIGNSNWLSASSVAAWSAGGAEGNYDTSYIFEQEFDTGLEDFKVDVTKYVEDVLDNSLNSGNNYGFILKFSSSYEADTNSYYTKKFSARDSEYYFNRPVIEAQWDSSIKDDRSNFFYSSSLAPAVDNLNTLYIYNNIGGRLKNIPSVGTGELAVAIYASSASAPSGTVLTEVTGGYVSTGIYSASVSITGTSETLHDVWYTGSVQFHTGTIYPESRYTGTTTKTNDYYVSITNLKKVYESDETSRFRIYTRLKGWSPTIYTRAVAEPQLYIPSSGS